MVEILRFLGALLTSARSLRAAREAEIVFLRQQLLVLRRSATVRPRLRNRDRLVFVWLYRLFPSLLDAAVIFKPETLVRWHRGGFRLFWRWKSTGRAGRPALPTGIRDLVRQISRENHQLVDTVPVPAPSATTGSPRPGSCPEPAALRSKPRRHDDGPANPCSSRQRLNCAE